MKKLVILLALATLTGTYWVSACATCGCQGKTKKECKMDNHLQQMKEKVGLSDDQVNSIQSIMEDKEAKMEVIRIETHGKVKALLSEEQQAKLEKFKNNSDCEKCDMKKEKACKKCSMEKGMCDACKAAKGKNHKQ